jgi:hypothetical protein
MIHGRFQSPQPPLLRARKREKESFETCFGLILPSSRLILALLVSRGVTTQTSSSKLLRVAPTPTTLATKKNSRIQHQKKFVVFNIKQQE